MSVVIADHDGGARYCSYADPAIKLFGRDIPLAQEASGESLDSFTVGVKDDLLDQIPHGTESKEPMDIVSYKPDNAPSVEVESKALGSISVKVGENQVISGAPVHSSLPKVEEAQGPLAEKAPKKPDKVLPCPRCHSLDTKFCYFNNYNVNQPRHFCRKCQRYWTAGGTLRNVPVGAGRRKNKHSASHQKHIMVSDAISMRMDVADMPRHHGLPVANVTPTTTLCDLSKPALHVLPLEAQPVSSLDSPSANSSVVSFGQESPLCRSMAATTLGIQESGNMQSHGMVNTDCIVASEDLAFGGKHMPQPEGCTSLQKMLPPSCQKGGSTSLSEVTLGVQVQEGEVKGDAYNGCHEMQADESAPSIHAAIWQPGSNIVPKGPFNPTIANSFDCESSTTTGLSSMAGLSLPSPNVLACNGSPGAFWPGFTWPYMNPALWGAPPLEWAGPWNMPVYPPGAMAAAAAAALLPYTSARSAAPQHQLPERSQPEKCLWVPKTLRIDDPLNAARSSLWNTLGLGDGPFSSTVSGSANTCQTKSHSKDDNKEAVSSSRLSNPAALSRSAAFHESS